MVDNILSQVDMQNKNMQRKTFYELDIRNDLLHHPGAQNRNVLRNYVVVVGSWI